MNLFVMRFAGVVCLFLLTSCTTYRGSFELINNASEPVVSARVSICGQGIELEGIKPTESEFAVYTVRGDSSYDIHIEFQSGKKLHMENGYVTRGFHFHHTIIVTDTGIELADELASHNKMK